MKFGFSGAYRPMSSGVKASGGGAPIRATLEEGSKLGKTCKIFVQRTS